MVEVDKSIQMVNIYAMSRLTIEIDPEQHRKIKTLATFAGMTLKEYILERALAPQSPKDGTTQELLGSPRNAARLREALASPEDTHRVFETIEELEDALGI
ncbi:MAG: hypothetical protein SFY92_09395 [Verrucomicrobiae bacterium]|nr:hypothetical protein [Verrucomicrobiae bacterium]